MSTKAQGVACYEKAKHNEEMFVLLARDSIAHHAVMYWAYLAAGGAPIQFRLPPITQLPLKIQESLDCAERMQLTPNRKHPVDGLLLLGAPGAGLGFIWKWRAVEISGRTWHLLLSAEGQLIGGVTTVHVGAADFWASYQGPELDENPQNLVSVYDTLDACQNSFEHFAASTWEDFNH